MKKIFVFLAILALPMLLFAAGGGQQASGAGGYLRFAWWGNTVRDERTVRVAQLFMEKNPGVVIETEPTTWDGYWQRMNTLAAAGSLPDVMQQDVSYIKQYADRNQLEPLDAYVQRGLIDLTHWAPAGLAAGILNGRNYGLVLGTNAWGLGVCSNTLQQAGITIDDSTWTWADYERIALQIFQRTGMQTIPIVAYTQVMEHVTRQFGAPLYSADERSMGMTNIPAAQAAFREVIDVHLRLRAAGALYDPDSAFIMGLAMEEQPLARGMVWNNQHWSNQHIGNQNAARKPLQYLMLPTMTSPPREPYGLYFRPSQYISMLSSSENKDLAARFIDFFVNDFDANRILLAERGIPVPTNVREDLYGRVGEDDRYLFDYISKITPYISPTDPPYPPRAGEVVDVMRPIIHQGFLGQIGNSTNILNQMLQVGNAVLTRP